MSLSMLPTGLRGLPPRVEAEVIWPARGQGDAAATERLGNPRVDPGLLLLLHRAEREQQLSLIHI